MIVFNTETRDTKNKASLTRQDMAHMRNALKT